MNWSAEAMVQRLRLISMSITNIVGSLRVEMGVAPETVRFIRPHRPDEFEEAWVPPGGVSFSNVDTVVSIETRDESSKEALLQELESRTEPGSSDRK